MTTVTIDPITRIEGHLKSEVSVTNGLVTDAKVSGTMARGIEQLLLGRDPRDATYVTERICGVCFGSHGWASSLAVEQAQGTTALPNAVRLLRNLIVGAAWLPPGQLGRAASAAGASGRMAITPLLSRRIMSPQARRARGY